jgi:hypothetical protein
MEEADVALFLNILPNVEEITLELPSNLSTWWHSVWKCTRGFRKIRSLEIRDPTASYFPWPLPTSLPILQGSNLRTFKTSRCCLDSIMAEQPAMFEPWSLTIISLSLDANATSIEDVRTLVEACASLQVFTFNRATAISLSNRSKDPFNSVIVSERPQYNLQLEDPSRGRRLLNAWIVV